MSNDPEPNVPEDLSLQPARLVRQEREFFFARTADKEYLCTSRGLFRRNEQNDRSYPVIGDFVQISPSNDTQAVIMSVEPRRNMLCRKKAGRRADVQVLTANIDVAFIVNGLDGGRNFSIRRAERFLQVTAQPEITSVLLLNKADLCECPHNYLEQMKTAFPNITTLLTSAVTGLGLPELHTFLPADSAAVFLGPSGVGKSALINQLANKTLQKVAPSRDSDLRGRHTTTNRQMFQLDTGAWIIDTPGIREIQPWDDAIESDAFADIEELALQCRFRNCLHRSEPGCAVQAAVADGQLNEGRYKNFLVVQQNRSDLTKRTKDQVKVNERRNWKKRKYQ